jgi:hypothetical protein
VGEFTGGMMVFLGHKFIHEKIGITFAFILCTNLFMFALILSFVAAGI